MHFVSQIGLRKESGFRRDTTLLGGGGNLVSFFKRLRTYHFHSVDHACNDFFRTIVVFLWERDSKPLKNHPIVQEESLDQTWTLMYFNHHETLYSYWFWSISLQKCRWHLLKYLYNPSLTFLPLPHFGLTAIAANFHLADLNCKINKREINGQNFVPE